MLQRLKASKARGAFRWRLISTDHSVSASLEFCGGLYRQRFLGMGPLDLVVCWQDNGGLKPSEGVTWLQDRFTET